jgi:nucleoside-triphosphatase THEP1
MIRILTGPIQSYKTTTLRTWVDQRTDCGGFLSPDVGGVRQLYHIRTKELVKWQHIEPQPGDVMIGRFAFDPGGFTSGITWLEEDFYDPLTKFIILDEVGPLELKGLGWHPWLRSNLPFNPEKTLILVVRSSLVEEVINKYQLENIDVVEKDFFIPGG